jgi:DNA polymerase V
MNYQQPETVQVHDGFPNAAADSSLQSLDLNKLLVKNPISTYYMRTPGGLIAIIDRAITPKGNDIVVWVCDDQFVMTPLHKVTDNSPVWGVVTSIINQLHCKVGTEQ